MAQHIGCRLQDERGNLITDSDLNFAPLNTILWDIDPEKKEYIWLHTIDEYGDTVFNPLQTPMVIAELEKLKNGLSPETQQLIGKFIEFIKTIGTHRYIRFLGD